jgi:hypothetical protein
MKEKEFEHREIFCHARIHWFSKGVSYWDLLQGLKQFIVSRDEGFVQFDSHDKL